MTQDPKDFIKKQTEKGSVRLNKYMSDCGVCSRRQADRLIEQGNVYVNGKRAAIGQQVFPEDTVEYGGRVLTPSAELILLAFNKPLGIECTSDRSNPDNIIDCISYESRIFPIGRLDKDSTGLILLTNTGELSDRILRGSNFHEKEYEVRIDRPVTDEFISKMEGGVPILDTVTRPCTVKRTGPDSFNIILTQGLNRQIRRMCEYSGAQVIGLKRIRIMNITLGGLREGCCRNVTDGEIQTLLKELYDG